MARKFKQISAEFTNLKKVGDFAEGTLLSREMEAAVKSSTRPVVVLREDSGKILKVPLSNTAKSDLAGVADGEYLKVTLVKMEPSGKGNDTKVFKLEVAVEG